MTSLQWSKDLYLAARARAVLQAAGEVNANVNAAAVKANAVAAAKALAKAIAEARFAEAKAADARAAADAKAAATDANEPDGMLTDLASVEAVVAKRLRHRWAEDRAAAGATVVDLEAAYATAPDGLLAAHAVLAKRQAQRILKQRHGGKAKITVANAKSASDP